MPAYQPPMSLAAGGKPIDAGRTPAVVPGYLVHSAQMNEEKLMCYHRCCCFCVNSEVVSRRTFVDVYSNGVLVNVPCACCCCIWDDAAKFLYYDKFFDGMEPVAVGCCNPCCPTPCAHGCNCCGETLGFKRGCGCVKGIGHWGASCCCCLCPIDVIAGLEEGEGRVLTDQILSAKGQFLKAGNANPPMDQAGGFVANAMATIGQAMPSGQV